MFSVSFIIGDVIGVTVVACHGDCHTRGPACGIFESSYTNEESAKKHNPVCKPVYLSGLDNARFFFASGKISQQNKTGEPLQQLGGFPGCALQTLYPERQGGTANRKERRRTQSINSAFAELRECIPNVPADTKLSKIKTLRLATSYIAYLMDLLAKDDQNGEAEAFKAEIKKTDVKEEKRKKELNEILKSTVSSNDKKTKGRTGWPQHVWALELKQ
ncbi:PREDICTED: heart- and neural crest derivatives-expressed protein 2 [Aptenodytes forsteri]|uniref:heart- and neural crest derivatives-expressed protein 2 n=1 Tax=Aptenodytes forsteri TaxID=9233 RepID=UPI0004F42164|nr:PREDICTED: heart- and neural crest derivatives-expressed protein 2 [Aptenodytes forsteri]